ncbi:MAG: Na/Pi cotransporter family protein [Planctomycetota bacterium]
MPTHINSRYFVSRLSCLTVLFLSLGVLIGCQNDQSLQPDKIEILENGTLIVKQNDAPVHPVRIEVLSDYQPGLLGGKGSRKPCERVGVLFKSKDARLTFSTSCATGAETDNGLYLSETLLVTDLGGQVRVFPVATGAGGTLLYTATVVNASDRSEILKGGKPIRATLAVHSGLSIDAPRQLASDSTSVQPIAVRAYLEDGRPAADIGVLFRLAHPEDGALTGGRAATDADGLASCGFKSGKDTGKSVVDVQIDGYDVFSVTVFRFDTLGIVIGVLAGLAIFLYGMKAMSDGLKDAAGDRIRRILQMLTQNRWIGLAVGVVVTGLIQSSSGMTVMVVGFVNAGLMQLQQAIALIIGSNIGTTVTAQLISFKIEKVALPAIAVGVLIYFFSKSRQTQTYGKVIIGFGFLFYGMVMMSDQLKPLAGSASVMDSLKWIDCTPGASGRMPLVQPLIGLAIGTLMTVLIQSSSATIGLLLAMASSGLVNFYTAVPILFGDNVGTTITANLAAIGANVSARRAALAHSLFNILGVLVMMPLFYLTIERNGHIMPIYLALVDMTVAGDPFSDTRENITRHIANAHTFFNVLNAAVFIFLTAPLARLVTRIIPDRKDPAATATAYLDARLLDTPPIALQLVIREIGWMSHQAASSFKQTFNSLLQADESKLEKLAQIEQLIDAKRDGITDYLSDLTTRPLTTRQAKCIPLMLHATNDIERIADHCESILKLARRRTAQGLDFSPVAQADLMDIQDHIIELFDRLLKVVTEDDVSDAKAALRDRKKVEAQIQTAVESHMARQECGDCMPAPASIFNATMTHLTRITGHLENIFESFIELHHWRADDDPDAPDATRKRSRETQTEPAADLLNN